MANMQKSINSSTLESKISTDIVMEDEVTSDDVLLGRGDHAVHHEGNVKFRQEIFNRKDAYFAAFKNREKDDIAKAVIDSVIARNGRFLRKANKAELEKIDVAGGLSVWLPVKIDAGIIRKIKQCIRDTEKNLTDSDGTKRTSQRATVVNNTTSNSEEIQDEDDPTNTIVDITDPLIVRDQEIQVQLLLELQRQRLLSEARQELLQRQLRSAIESRRRNELLATLQNQAIEEAPSLLMDSTLAQELRSSSRLQHRNDLVKAILRLAPREQRFTSTVDISAMNLLQNLLSERNQQSLPLLQQPSLILAGSVIDQGQVNYRSSLHRQNNVLATTQQVAPVQQQESSSMMDISPVAAMIRPIVRFTKSPILVPLSKRTSQQALFPNPDLKCETKRPRTNF